jgi:hypothetical protein
MNELAPDVSLTGTSLRPLHLDYLVLVSPGNHDFDFGYPHLCKLVQDTTFVRHHQ